MRASVGAAKMNASLATHTPPAQNPRRTFGLACGAHALHDGFTDLLYVLLPIWQTQFGLTYGEVGLLRALYAGAMAGFQMPAGSLAGRFGGGLILSLGTALAGLGFLVVGASTGFSILALGLIVAGLGSSTQHPIASDLVAHAYVGPKSRQMLGAYNFAGDVGKMVLPAATALLLIWMPWPAAFYALGAFGLIAAAVIWKLAGKVHQEVRAAAASSGGMLNSTRLGRGFYLLLAIGIIDSATRMGFLTFLPFLLREKGADLPMIGFALSVVFAGGAVGKLVCGVLGQRLSVLRTVLLTEGATALGIIALLPLDLAPAMALLALIGVMLNGTSSVLYGSVPELVTSERRAGAFGLFYTGTIGSGAVAPVVYGLFSDALGVSFMMMIISGIVLFTLPLAVLLNSSFSRQPTAPAL